MKNLVLPFCLWISLIINVKSSQVSSVEDASLKFFTTVLPFDQHSFVHDSPENTLNYCSFFNNRAPSPQINLKNCTWYKENSCCLQQEIDSTFSEVKPLIGSSELCQKYLNYLMCYICAPNQFKFYGNERLTVCIEYCDKMYEACAEAILKGSKINKIYSNGEEFCQSRRYNIDKTSKEDCFFYKIQSETLNSAIRLGRVSSLGVYLLVALMHVLCFQ